MESPHWFGRVRVNLNWSAVHFRNGLQFDVVSPDAVLPLLLDILVELFIRNEGRKVTLVGLEVVHALLSDQAVQLLTTVDLVSDRPEQAVAVAFDLLDAHFLVCQFPPKAVFSAFP